MKKLTMKLSEDSAQEQLNQLLDYYEIDFNDIPTQQKDSFEMIGKKLVKFIRQGRLEIKTEDGIQCIQTLRNGTTTITYKELNGKAKTAMGTKSAEDGNGRIYALMGALSDGETMIAELKGPDLSLVECLGAVWQGWMSTLKS